MKRLGLIILLLVVCTIVWNIFGEDISAWVSNMLAVGTQNLVTGFLNWMLSVISGQ